MRRSVRGVSAAPQAHYPHFLKPTWPEYILNFKGGVSQTCFLLNMIVKGKQGWNIVQPKKGQRGLWFSFPSLKKRELWIQSKNLKYLKLTTKLVKTVALVLLHDKSKDTNYRERDKRGKSKNIFTLLPILAIFFLKEMEIFWKLISVCLLKSEFN